MPREFSQTDFDKKAMIEDSKGMLIPQHFDAAIGVFVPEYKGSELPIDHNSKRNPYQYIFNEKSLLVDRKRRVIPQYYDSGEGVFKPSTQSVSDAPDNSSSKFKWVYNEETESLDLVFKI